MNTHLCYCENHKYHNLKENIFSFFLSLLKYKVLIRLDHKVFCKSWIWPDFDTVALVLHCSALSENNMTLYILSLDVWWQKE